MMGSINKKSVTRKSSPKIKAGFLTLNSIHRGFGRLLIATDEYTVFIVLLYLRVFCLFCVANTVNSILNGHFWPTRPFVLALHEHQLIQFQSNQV